MDSNKLINSNITWISHQHKRFFYTKNNGSVILLRVNNFPEEPLLTLINGLEVFDIEDTPIGWIFER